MLNCSQRPSCFQVHCDVRIESPHVPFTAHLVFQSTVRSEDRGNSFNTWLAVHLTQIHAPGRPGANEINHLKN